MPPFLKQKLNQNKYFKTLFTIVSIYDKILDLTLICLLFGRSI